MKGISANVTMYKTALIIWCLKFLIVSKSVQLKVLKTS